MKCNANNGFNLSFKYAICFFKYEGLFMQVGKNLANKIISPYFFPLSWLISGLQELMFVVNITNACQTSY